MASEKNITMRQYNGVDYDTLYPKTIAEQVIGIYSKDEILGDATKTIYGLGADAVPDDVFEEIKNILGGFDTRITKSGIVCPFSYVGTGTWGPNNPNSITFDFAPSVIILLGSGSTLPGKWIFQMGSMPTSDANGWGFYNTITSYQQNYGKKSSDGKTYYWYIRYDSSTSDFSDMQCNTAGVTYYGIALG